MTTSIKFLRSEQGRRAPLTIEQIKRRVAQLMESRAHIENHRLKLPHDFEHNNHYMLANASKLLRWKVDQLQQLMSDRLSIGQAYVSKAHREAWGVRDEA
ncbi:MAG: hypothetical protein KME14_20520 [Tildeniella torsiva UHER 1998/13D]|jgi:hypothetical protein|nr:hypothetical protein [Tildeniella torsiva UHER 1998/13D]